MMDFVLLISVLAVLGAAGYFVWKLRRDAETTHGPSVPARRREDARDWQRRFMGDALYAANFHQPTQNEILETLYALDHLTPGWEKGETETVTHLCLNELSQGFPNLRKSNCLFPLPFTATRALLEKARSNAPRNARGIVPSEAEMIRQREEFRQARAQTNALQQISSGGVVPQEVLPGSLPFRLTESKPKRRAMSAWLPRLAGIGVLASLSVAAVRYFPGIIPVRQAYSSPVNVVDPADAVPASQAEGQNPPAIPTTNETTTANATFPMVPGPSIAPVATGPVAVATPQPQVMPALSVMPAAQHAALIQKIAESKQRAVSKYPALAVEGSEINIRFISRYKNLVLQNSPRLQDPTWPEQLVEECAVAAGITYKRSAFTQVLAPRH